MLLQKGFHHTMTHLKSTVFWADISFLSSLFMDGHTQWSQEIYGVALEFKKLHHGDFKKGFILLQLL